MSRRLFLRREARRVYKAYLAMTHGDLPPLQGLVSSWEYDDWDHFLRRAGPSANFWKEVALAPDFDAAVHELAERGVSLHDAILPSDLPARVLSHNAPDQSTVPTWVILHLLCIRIEQPEDIKLALSLVYYQIPHAKWRWRGALLIVTAGWLAEFNMVAPLQQLLELFVTTKRVPVEYQMLLHVLTLACKSRATGNLVSPLVAEASSRGMDLGHRTYDRLLAAPFANAQLGLTVARAMHTEGVEPSQRNLERLVKLFVKRGWTRLAGRTIRQLRPLQVAPISPVQAERMLATEDCYLSSLGSTRLHAYMHARTQRLVLDKPRASTWRAMLRSAAEDDTMGSGTLFALYKAGKSMSTVVHEDFVVDLITISGLLDRGSHASALSVWDSIADRAGEMLHWGICVGVRALTMGGLPREAFELMLEATPSDVTSSVVPLHPTGALSSSKKLDLQTVNVFLHSLQRTQRPDVVFELWDNFEIIFGLRPDQYTLTILLRTAILAGAPDTSIRSALADIGLSFLTTSSSSVDSLDPSPENCRSLAVARIRELLSSNSEDLDTSMWSGERVGVRALRVTRRILLNNWPELRFVVPPACKPNEVEKPRPITRLLLRLQERSHSDSSVQDVDATAPQEEDEVKPPGPWPHAHIVPNDVVFSAYITLLGLEMRRTDIPVALAWMRHLGVKPTKNALAISLVYWAEIRMGAPLVETLMDQQSPYRRLLTWMGEWVGVDNLPTEADIGRQLQKIRAMREKRERNAR